jgi:hypothetical protein
MPALRLDAGVPPALPSSPELRVQLLGVRASRVLRLRGWRTSFSPLSRTEIAGRLRPTPVRLIGPELAGDARALRVWIRADTQYPRIVVLHFLLRGQDFAHVRAGAVLGSWRRLEVPLSKRLRGAQLVGVEFLPTFVPLNHDLDVSGSVDLGSFEERLPTGWSRLPALRTWTAAAGDSGGGYLVTNAPFEAGAPVRRGLEFALNGTATPLIRPGIGLPHALPALVSESVAAEAVDGRVNVDLAGRELTVRVAGVASRFPTVVRSPENFVVLDYDALFAALNADRPGSAVPSEAWFFRARPPGPFGREVLVGVEKLRGKLLGDPLARGTRDVLGVTAIVAATLALLGLLIGVRLMLGSERLVVAEYEALGVPPSTLVRSMQLRLVLLSALGIGAGFLGGLVAGRLIGAFVAVTGAASAPLPSILPVVAWGPLAVVLGTVAAVALATTLVMARGALRKPAARRLTA